jgi:hypothetical protein
VLDAEDDNNSASSEFSVGTSPAFTTVIGGMYEVYNAKGCQTLFANHHLVFRNLSVGKYSTTTPFHRHRAPLRQEAGQPAVQHEHGVHVDQW